MGLSEQEQVRYSRHIALPQVGMEGQLKLKNARVLIIGAGGLGSPAGLYLAAAGIGQIGIVDDDLISLSNLQRQVLYSADQVQTSKTLAAKKRLSSLNSEIQIQTYNHRLTAENSLGIISSYDVILDGTDNFSTRYLINDACVLAGKPNIYGAIFGFDGQASLFYPPGGPCYRCLYPQPPEPGAVPSCNENGVLGVLPGIIGTIQAAEAIKYVLGIGTTLQGRLLTFDALSMNFSTIRFNSRVDCPSCGKGPRIQSLIEHSVSCGFEISAQELFIKIRENPDEIQIVDVRNLDEYENGHIGGALHIPLDQLGGRAKELDPKKEIIVYCRSGVRSLRAVEVLNSMGIMNVFQLRPQSEEFRY